MPIDGPGGNVRVPKPIIRDPRGKAKEISDNLRNNPKSHLYWARNKDESYADYVTRMKGLHEKHGYVDKSAVANMVNGYDPNISDELNNWVVLQEIQNTSPYGRDKIKSLQDVVNSGQYDVDGSINTFNKYNQQIFGSGFASGKLKQQWRFGRALKDVQNQYLRPDKPNVTNKTTIRQDRRRGGDGGRESLGPRARLINNAYGMLNDLFEGKRTPEPISPNMGWGDPFGNSPYAGGNMGMMNNMTSNHHRIMQGQQVQQPGMIRLGQARGLGNWLG